MHPYISQALATEHMLDEQRKASAARLVAEASRTNTGTAHRHTHRWGIAERAAWQRLIRSA